MTGSGVGIAGAGGHMGRMLVQALKADGLRLVAATERNGSELLGRDAGELAGVGTLGVPLESDPQTLFTAGVVIDFTTVEATLAHLPLAMHHSVPMVIGTTGFEAAGRARIDAAATRIPIVFAPNFSVGVNLMFKVAAEVAAVLGDAFDVEIIEAHHRRKVDAPSGTAVRLGETIAAALGRNLADVAVYGREGITGARDSATIGFATVRGGDIVGEHTALFAGEGERLEITHRASSRMTFAKGAVRAARWVVGRPPGLYDMRDLLGLREPH
ncbi:MAG: 4-hydroxy-tetrahydrodipicolinate reductase [Magnetococcales bacterium]|nr:4-hydroxy-tetrahydrodipicolinate reductase [Magnetococcales bacterium]